MTKFTRGLILFMAFYVAIALQTASAQSVLDPTDPVITYDSTKPPVQPPDGQIGKWVRTVRMTWNTDMYKAYIYKGLAFRLHFPKTYNPTANDGKKYPIMVFFHGHGEFGPITDNEFHLLHGHEGFDQAIQNGTFDGYVLSAQSTDFFNSNDYDRIMQVVNYMIQNNKVDPFHITVNGLSQGGQACWEMLSTYPTYISGSQPMSWSQASYTDATFINKIKYTPNWVFQGSEDTNPYPSTTYSVRDAMVAAGANFRLTVYQGVGHGTWYNAWSESDFWPFINQAYSSNPWQLGGPQTYWPGTAINATIGLPAGFSAYEWRKDGVQISGAASNTISVNSGGTYSARVQRNGIWSDWSHLPVIIAPGRYEAENYTAMNGVLTESCSDIGFGHDVGWIAQGDWMDYSINPTTAGTYTMRFRIATPGSGGKIAVKKADGTVMATVDVPSTGGWQNWQTISIPVTLAAGTQTIRLESVAVNGWNINWIEFATGATGNQAPTVNAGPSQTINLPASSVTLNGTASDPDGSIASYSWTKVTGGAATITSPSSASTTVTGLVQGSYTFRLTVTDNLGAASSSDVNVTVNGTANQTPTANAGADQSITQPASSVTLSGSGTDADGTIASYAWTKLSGGAATITSPSSASTTVTGLTQGSYTFRLTVTDNSGATATDDVVVTVNASVPSGSSLHIEAENWSAMSGVLTESTADVGGTLDVGWIDNGDWMDYAINPSASGTYTLKLRIATPYSTASLQVKNGATVLASVSLPNTGGYQNWQTVSVTVNLTAGPQTLRLASNSASGWNINWLELSQGSNQAPTANAGADQSITQPASSVTLSGSGTDADGTIASYAWTKLSGGAATITSPSSASTTVTGLTQGSYTFRLTVTDNSGATATDDVVVTVNASVPSGSSLHIEAENWSAMSGVLTESTADVGGTLDVGWIDNGDWMDYAINPSASGTYTLKLRIATPYSTASLQVKNGATVLASVSLPNTGGYQNWQTVSVTVNLTAGPQTLRLASNSASGWNINWLELSQGSNQAPTANAGADQSITQPASSVTLSGSGTDADGTIASYAWTKLSGGAATITSPSSASTTVTGLTQGSYTFRLTVTDNSGATATDDVVVTVNASVPSGSSLHIEAENWSAMSGVLTESTADVGGTLDVGWIDNGDWMDYAINPSASGTYTLKLRIATPYSTASLQVKNGATVLASVTLPNTGAWQTWQTVSVTVNLTAGPQTLRLAANSSLGWNINWLEIGSTNNAITGRIAASPVREQMETVVTTATIYPNPVRDRFSMTFQNSYSGSMKVQVVNMTGAIQKQFLVNKSNSISRTELSIGDLPKGEYLLLIDMNGKKETRKIIKL